MTKAGQKGYQTQQANLERDKNSAAFVRRLRASYNTQIKRLHTICKGDGRGYCTDR